MIEIKKTSFLSNDYVAVHKRKPLAKFNRSFWSQKAEMQCEDQSLTLSRKGALKSAYYLSEGERILLEVTQPSALNTKLTFHYDDCDYELVSKAWHSHSFLIKANDKEIGSIDDRGFLKTGAIVNLPDKFPTALQVFLGWLALVRWDDDANAAAAAG